MDAAVEEVNLLTRFLSSVRVTAVPVECEEPAEDSVETEESDYKCESCFMDGSEVPLGSYVVCIQAKSRPKRLRRVGSCHRRPEKNYATFWGLGRGGASGS